VTGDDSAPTFTGWTVFGSGVKTAYRDYAKHGLVSIRTKTTSAVSERIQQCIPASPSTAYYMSYNSKTLSGTPNIYLQAAEYSDVGCSAYVTYHVITSGPQEDDEHGGTFTTNVATNSILFDMYAPHNSIGDILIDSVSLKAGSYRTPWVSNPGAGSSSYSSRVYKLHNTLSDAKPDGSYPWSAGFCASTWIYSDWDGANSPTVSTGILNTNQGGGPANAWYLGIDGTHNLLFALYDSAANVNYRYSILDATTWSAHAWHFVEICTSNTGTHFGHWYNVNNATWYDMFIDYDLGTGIQTASLDPLWVGKDVWGNYLEGYVSNVCIMPYSATYTNCNFNGGQSPKRPY
jgi:hypothetical protein